MSDEILAGTLPALKRSGLTVPNDCAVVAISDGYLPNYLDPLVTFVKHSGYTIGQQAAELLCKLIEQTDTQKSFNIVVETQLLVQASTMGIRDWGLGIRNSELGIGNWGLKIGFFI